MPSSLKVQLTSDAVEDVLQIGAFTRERWGEAKSDEYLDAIERSLDLLGEYPERGAVYIPIPEFRWIPVRDYNVYYRVGRNRLDVLRIIHRRRNAAAHLQEP